MNGRYAKGSAVFSNCGRYRYVLRRVWDESKPSVLFIGLNPSTADAEKDDPTIRRCVRFAADLGFGAVIVVNLFAYRATEPGVLKRVRDPVGRMNDRWIARSRKEAGFVIAAWGVHGVLRGRDRVVMGRLGEAFCLGRTKGGQPRHPLYLSRSARPVAFGGKPETTRRGGRMTNQCSND